MTSSSLFEKFQLDWESLDLVIEGKSAFDAERFLGGTLRPDSIDSFLAGYGLLNPGPVMKAELFGNFQEALQLIRRYFLKEGSEETGIDLKIPSKIFMITDLEELVRLAAQEEETEDKLWAEVILKVVHTILHVDKDLRNKFFKNIQTQVFDRFYRYIQRDSNNKLYLGKEGQYDLPLLEFDTKSKKSRDSVIIKLIHKAENVAEELFDRVGIRFVTENRFDCLRVINFLISQGVVVAQNIKPSRSQNSLINFEAFKNSYLELISKAEKEKLSEAELLQEIENIIEPHNVQNIDFENAHSSDQYRSLQFTARQLIRYRDPFLDEFNKFKQHISEQYAEDAELISKMKSLNTSNISKTIEFFYPYEIQVVDKESHENNLVGEASHQEYKKAQVISARNRLFKKLVSFYQLEI